MTKEQVDGLLEGLSKLGLGVDDGNVVSKPQPIQSDALLMLEISVLFIRSYI